MTNNYQQNLSSFQKVRYFGHPANSRMLSLEKEIGKMEKKILEKQALFAFHLNEYKKN